jgi:hypothetical protein
MNRIQNITKEIKVFNGWDSSVSIVTRLWDQLPDGKFSIE